MHAGKGIASCVVLVTATFSRASSLMEWAER